MYELYDDMPLGVAVLEISSLNINYLNSKFKSIFKISYESTGCTLDSIDGIKSYNVLMETLKKRCNKKLKRINLFENMFFDLDIDYKENFINLFLYETTEYIERELKIKNEREKFLGIWSEMKTKCDLIEKLRIKEKEHLTLLKDVVNHMSEGLIVLDEYGEVSFFNKAVLNITGLSLEKIKEYRSIIKGLNVFGIDLVNLEKDLGQVFSDFLIHKKTIKDIVIKLLKGNATKYIRITCTPVKDDYGRLKNSIILIDDITKILEHEIELEFKNKELEKVTRMKDDFFNIMSHELRTPLTIIHSSIQLAEDIYKSEITENIEKILTRITQSSRRLLKLINNILDISKAEAGFLQLNYKPCDVVCITESLTSSANLYAKSKSIELIFDTTEEEVLVLLDRDKYEKIVLNLLSNAIKFTPSHKTILVKNIFEKDYFEIRVKDEGIGISKNKIDKIFDRFIQVENSLSKHSDGTGLGLSLVKKLVELMDGIIIVESEPGKGTEFIVRFPKNQYIEENFVEHCTKDEFNNNKVIIEFSDVS